MIFSHDNLIAFVKTNFDLKKYHNYSMNEIESMLPWERRVHIDQIKSQVSVERERQREEELRAKR